MKYNRFLPLLTPILTYVFLLVYLIWPKLVYLSIVFICLIFLFTIRQFLLQGKKEEKWWNIFIWPFCFVLGTVFFSMFIPSRAIVHFLLLLALFFLYFYFRTVYFYLVKFSEYKNQSLQNLSSFGNFLSFYYLISAVYGFQVFLNLKISYLMIGVMIFCILIIYQVFWSNKISFRDKLHFILISALVIIELSWAVSFLTLSFYILGMIIAVSYYIIIGMVRFYLLGNLNKKLVKLYLFFGFFSITLVLFTSRWIGSG